MCKVETQLEQYEKSVWNTWNKIGKYYSFIKKLLQLLAELYFSKLTQKNWTDRLSRMNLIFSPNCPSIASFEYRLMMVKTFPEFYERSDKRGVISNEKNIEWKKYQMMQTIIANFSQPSTFCLGKFFQCRIKSNIKRQTKLLNC